MRPAGKLWFLLCWPLLSFSQQYKYYQFPEKKDYDKLVQTLPAMRDERQKMAAYHQMAYYLSGEKRDSSLYYMNLELGLARKYGLTLWEADALDGTAYNMWRMGDYPGALQRFLAGIKLASGFDDRQTFWGVGEFDQGKSPRAARLILLTQLEFDLSTLYQQAGDTTRELEELLKGERNATLNHDKSALAQINDQLGSYFLARRQLDSALVHSQRSVAFAGESDFGLFEQDALNDIGTVYALKGDAAQAKTYFLKAVVASKKVNSDAGLTHAYASLSEIYRKGGRIDSALYYARMARVLIRSTHDLNDAVLVNATLASLFKRLGRLDSAYAYQQLVMAAKDSLNDAHKIRQFQNVGFNEQLRIRQLEQEKTAAQDRIRFYTLIVGLAVVLLIAFILWRNSRQQQRANAMLEKTLADLKATQRQLIQSEKMASLGELTAGIAHEIQNPLNFVNNFSEVSVELLEELKEEARKGDTEEVIAIADDLSQNLSKIGHHGKRADSIVKGMLEHSRVSAGQKEPADLNKLISEYVQLAYHGFRAKHQNFQAAISSDLEADLPIVDLVPPDIGRVLLNLLNNAFYAVKGQADAAIRISTAHRNGYLLVTITDNGPGIPENIREKILQPFFTTKPTGEGTGLGLSLSYDIIVKGHRGSLKIESEEHQFTTVTLSIPAHSQK